LWSIVEIVAPHLPVCDVSVQVVSIDASLICFYSQLRSDVEKILALADLKSNIGRTRAFVRLAIEKQQLGTYLEQILSR
jgi:hypothetical protein